MLHSTAFDTNCPIARVTRVLGDNWSILLLREAFLGTRHFNDFERELGIARNILSARLKKMVDVGLLCRTRSADDRRVIEYRLTEAGSALFPVLVGLAQWSGEWLCSDCDTTRFVERSSGAELPPVHVRSASGEVLGPADVAMLPGADADSALRGRYERARQASEREGR